MDNRNDYSQRTDGEMAGENMRQSGDMLSLLANVHARLEKVESDNSEMRAIIDAAKTAGEFDFDSSHVRHVMEKHFYHDRPEPAVTN